jgi:hypothetical protein
MDENVALAWKSEAASMGLSLSQFVQLAVDAGVLVLRAQGTTRPKSATPPTSSKARHARARGKRPGRATVKALSDGDSGRLRARG